MINGCVRHVVGSGQLDRKTKVSMILPTVSLLRKVVETVVVVADAATNKLT